MTVHRKGPRIPYSVMCIREKYLASPLGAPSLIQTQDLLRSQPLAPRSFSDILKGLFKTQHEIKGGKPCVGVFKSYEVWRKEKSNVLIFFNDSRLQCLATA